MLSSCLFYLVLLFICVLIAYWTDKYNSKKLLFLLISLLAFVTGLRGEKVGIDTVGYVEIWDGIMADDLVAIELGFRWLILLLQRLTDNPTSMFLLCSFIIYFFMIIRLWDFRRFASFSMMIAVLFMSCLMPSMNTMRQYCAVAIIFFFTRYFFKKQYFMFSVGVILATLLHTSSLLAFSFLGFELINWRQLSIFKKLLFILLILLLPIIALMAYELIMVEYGIYFEDTSSNLGLLTALKFVFILFSFLLSKLYVKIKRLDDYFAGEGAYVFKFVFGAALLGVVLESFGYFFPFMDRIGLLFSIFGIVYWGGIFKMTIDKKLRILYYLSLLLLVGWPFLASILSNGYGTVPYSLD